MAGAIEITNLVKTFPGPGGRLIRAVDGLTISAQPGEVLAFLGPNGAGKTTTIKMCCGLVVPDSGSIRIGGFEPSRQPRAVQAYVGAVLECPRNVYGELTCAENVRYFGRLRFVPSKVLRTRIEELLDFLGLTEKRDARAMDLSRGMQQKLAIACALVHDPQTLFLDEPTIGLDVAAARLVKDRIRAMARQGRTVFLTTHQLDLVEEVADRVAVFNRGRLLMDGSVASLQAHFQRGRYRFVVQPAMGAEAERELSALGGVESTHEGFVLRFHGKADVQAALDVLRRRELALLEMTPLEPTLEEAFMMLIDGEGSPAAARGEDG